MTLNNRVVLVTGGKRIGQVVARELAARGADVAVSYRGSKEEADATVAEVGGMGRAGHRRSRPTWPGGATARRWSTAVVAELGRLDVLVNMASIYGATDVRRDDRAGLAAQHRREPALRLPLRARLPSPHMRRAGGGRIVNFADWLARSGRPAYKGFVAYYTAKAGVIALTEALALELAPRPGARQRHRARPDPAAAGHDGGGAGRGGPRHPGRPVGRGTGRSRTRSALSSSRTSSRAKPSAWMADATSSRRATVSHHATRRARTRSSPAAAAASAAASPLRYAQEGANVAINYAGSARRGARRRWPRSGRCGVRGVILPADVSRVVPRCRQLIADAAAALGPLDILVNNAGDREARAVLGRHRGRLRQGHRRQPEGRLLRHAGHGPPPAGHAA